VWQETNNSVDGQRSGVNITGCICKAVCLLSRRCTFGEFESMAVPSRRRWRMFKQPQCHLRLRHKISAWDSGGAAGSTRVATCLGPPRRVQRPDFRWIAFLSYVSTLKITIATHH
jgi:hypothetical protein